MAVNHNNNGRFFSLVFDDSFGPAAEKNGPRGSPQPSGLPGRGQ